MRNAVALALAGSALILVACGGDDEPTPPSVSFTLSVTPTTLSIQAGASGGLNITIARSGGFDGAVSVTAEGLPAGVTASALSIAAGATTGTLTLSAAASATAGTSNVTIRATGSGASAQTTTVALTITAAPGFTLALTPATLSIVSGQSGSTTANITRVGGFTGAVNLTSSGAPTGITVAFTPASVTGGSAAIAVNVGASVAAGAYTITISGSGTGVSNQTATLTVTVTAPVIPTIALALNPATLSVQQGAQGTSALTITRTNFTGAVALAATGAPTGVTVSFNPASVTATTSTVTVDVGGTAALGNHTITITGTGTGVANAVATLTLTVTAPPASGIALALAPAALSIAAGASGTSDLTITRTNFAGSVALAASGAPAGMTVTINPASTTTNAATITVDVGAAVAPANYPVTITGSGTGISNATATLTVTVTAPTPAISIAVTPATLSIQAGASGTTNLALTRTNFTGDVTLTSTGAPAGMTVAFNPATLTGATLASTVTVTVGAAVAAGTHNVTLQAAGTGVTSSTIQLQVTVTAAAGSITLTTTPATLSVVQGASGQVTLNIARTNFVGTVNLTSSGEPAGVTVSFNPASTTTNSSTVTLNVGGSVIPGTYQITVTGAGTGITNATVNVSLTVTQSGGGSGNVTLTFCQQSGIPLWVGYSSNGGAWTQATGTNNVYSFNITTRGIVAYVLPSGTTTQLNVIYGTQAELTARGASLCLSTAALKTINVTVNGVSAGEIGNVSMSGGGGAVIGGIGSNVVQLQNVLDGPRDLIGVRGALAGAAITPNSIVIQRDLNLPNNGNATVDFATGVAPLSRTVTIANLGAQEATFLGNFLSKNFTSANLSLSAGGTTLTRTWFGVPDANTVAGDFHTQTVLAMNAGQTSAFPSRAMVVWNRLATNQTLTLPDAISTSPTVTVASNTPYATINSSWTVQNPYNQFWTLSFSPTSNSPSAIVTGSTAYFGAGPVQLNIPNFGSSFNAAHGLQAGVALTWMFTGNGGTIGLGGPAEGANQVFATVGGTITP
ncbi:MAG: hypothetical protein AB1762_03330 [Gemmatimonadota bacterium]